MKIFIDIGHPAHVHYFRNFISIMQNKGHDFFISARKRSIIHYLLKKYNITYFDRGRGKDNFFGKFLYILLADIILYFKSLKFKPDLFLSFGTPYAAHVSFFCKKPHIAFTDTEHAILNKFLIFKFTDLFLTPSCFYSNFGNKHLRFDSYMELCYLHHNYFIPNPDIFQSINLSIYAKFVVIRFVSWKANHDIGHIGLDLQTKKKIIDLLIKEGYKVLISNESESIDPYFEKYLININSEKIHDVLFYASFLITEGATMASECAMLGTPAIYINSLDAGTLREQQDKYGLIFGFRNSTGVIEKVLELIQTPNLKQEFHLRCKKMLSEKIDLTALMVWFIENYPKSEEIMRSDPDYQYQFK